MFVTSFTDFFSVLHTLYFRTQYTLNFKPIAIMFAFKKNSRNFLCVILNASVYQTEVVLSFTLPKWDFPFFAAGLNLSNAVLGSGIVLATSADGFHATRKTHR